MTLLARTRFKRSREARKISAALAFLPVLICGCERPVRGSELVHLASGFDLDASSHQLNGAMFKLLTDSGTIEVPASEVTGIDISPATAVENKAVPSDANDLVKMLRAAARSQASNPEFIRFVQSVAEVESSLRQGARSGKGATGIMQLMPGTAKELGVKALDAADNVRGGARYLRELLLRYHNDSVLALAAYNAGPGAVKRYGGVPPYLETRRYIQKVLQAYAKAP